MHSHSRLPCSRQTATETLASTNPRKTCTKTLASQSQRHKEPIDKSLCVMTTPYDAFVDTAYVPRHREHCKRLPIWFRHGYQCEPK
ncbi:hypothetical protein FHS27_003763 [Rhodopirellula rubra]|uniref:Uncharacterized protein n=1 Tax=Aporhodopirellula rubra TaxID=980271 RepID=A0A7W5H7G3_9BACT|nr:hypothetical protein [Aporhodopirellula rubra]